MPRGKFRVISFAKRRIRFPANGKKIIIKLSVLERGDGWSAHINMMIMKHTFREANRDRLAHSVTRARDFFFCIDRTMREFSIPKRDDFARNIYDRVALVASRASKCDTQNFRIKVCQREIRSLTYEGQLCATDLRISEFAMSRFVLAYCEREIDGRGSVHESIPLEYEKGNFEMSKYLKFTRSLCTLLRFQLLRYRGRIFIFTELNYTHTRSVTWLHACSLNDLSIWIPFFLWALI